MMGITKKFDAALIVNDHPDIALAADADGVHLGQDDLPVKEARKIMGKTGSSAYRPILLNRPEMLTATALITLGSALYFIPRQKTQAGQRESKYSAR